jgi:hypothetical protein
MLNFLRQWRRVRVRSRLQCKTRKRQNVKVIVHLALSKIECMSKMCQWLNPLCVLARVKFRLKKKRILALSCLRLLDCKLLMAAIQVLLRVRFRILLAVLILCRQHYSMKSRNWLHNQVLTRMSKSLSLLLHLLSHSSPSSCLHSKMNGNWSWKSLKNGWPKLWVIKTRLKRLLNLQRMLSVRCLMFDYNCPVCYIGWERYCWINYEYYWK